MEARQQVRSEYQTSNSEQIFLHWRRMAKCGDKVYKHNEIDELFHKRRTRMGHRCENEQHALIAINTFVGNDR